jgi:3-phenylpropionate/trans-cinnamate dioxygenase ferredoxin reductase subunit
MIGGFFAQLHREHGVDVRLGTAVTAPRHARVTAVVTDDSGEIPTDVVIAGVGAGPNNEPDAAAGFGQRHSDSALPMPSCHAQSS